MNSEPDLILWPGLGPRGLDLSRGSNVTAAATTCMRKRDSKFRYARPHEGSGIKEVREASYCCRLAGAPFDAKGCTGETGFVDAHVSACVQVSSFCGRCAGVGLAPSKKQLLIFVSIYCRLVRADHTSAAVSGLSTAPSSIVRLSFAPCGTSTIGVWSLATLFAPQPRRYSTRHPNLAIYPCFLYPSHGLLRVNRVNLSEHLTPVRLRYRTFTTSRQARPTAPMPVYDANMTSSRPTRHRPNLSNSSNTSSDNGTSSSEGSHQHGHSSKPGAWERLRRPSTASSTKRPQYNESNRSISNVGATIGRNNGNGVTSPAAAMFASHDMMRTASDDSYLHILASRRPAQDSDTASISSFTCSLSKEFDRQRRGADAHAATRSTAPSSASSYAPNSAKQAWLDSTFDKLSALYRSKRAGKGANEAQPASKVKPHFLDLSSVICPVPSLNGSTRSRSKTIDALKTPQADESRELMLDLTTPKPTQTQHFAAHTKVNAMRLPSPPPLSPLTPSFALQPLPLMNADSHLNVSNGHSMMQSYLGGTVDDLHKVAASPSTGGRLLRKQKSFDVPTEMRRRQRREWGNDENNPKGLSIGIPRIPDWARSQHLRSGGNGSAPTSPANAIAPPLPSPATMALQHPSVSHLARPAAMTRTTSHDTADRQQQQQQQQQHSPLRPRLGTRSSSSALRHMELFDPTSSTGFTSVTPSDAATSHTRPPPLMHPSRESYGSSTGSESLPQTPVSATYLRSLPYVQPISPPLRNVGLLEEKEYIREWGRDQELSKTHHTYHAHQLQQPSYPHAHPAMTGGGALGLMPGMMIRAHSDSPAQPSRLRSDSDASNGSDDLGFGGPVYNANRTPRPARSQQRPIMRREHTALGTTVLADSPTKRGLAPELMAIPGAPVPGLSTTPRSSSLQDLQAEGEAPTAATISQRMQRASLMSVNSESSESSLAYTKPSPNPEQSHAQPQRSDSTRSHDTATVSSSNVAVPSAMHRDDSQATGLSITPTNSYRTDLCHESNTSKWSPATPPQAPASTNGNGRRRANSRADEWAANLRKLTRSTAAK
ncbi:hypothetical protein BCV70DRAFT_206473 [Testicularia cyperi]|uniref:Uncharacterized protein n=1 Tax=Testicularia cyperi TaxID=1882483 RepID=A0A317XQ47_9BASI|nr:hypothetical protein BCV70DRAFT_206473 [Testicularia cyperi]